MKYSTNEWLTAVAQEVGATAYKLMHGALYAGGITLYHDGIDRKYGFVVGGAVNSVIKIDLSDLDYSSLTALSEFLSDYGDEGVGYGSWLDNNTIYIDVVDWTDSLAYATKLAEERNELSIYDIGSSRCLDVCR